MKKLNSLILILLFGIGSSKAQGNETLIKDIRKKYKVITEYQYVDSTVVENEAFMGEMTDGGGELTGYYRKGELSCIKVFYGLSYGVINNSYYFWNNQLFFVYETEDAFYYDVDADSWNYDSLQNTFQGRYYFQGADIFEVKLKNKPLFKEVAKLNWELKAAELNSNAKKYVAILKKKRSE